MGNTENGKYVGWLMAAGFILASLAIFANNMFNNDLFLTLYLPVALVLGILGLILVTDWQGMRTQYAARTQEQLRESEPTRPFDRFQRLLAEPVILRVCGMLLVAGALILIGGVGQVLYRWLTAK